MTAIAEIFAEAFKTRNDLESFQTVALFSGVGLVTSLFSLLLGRI
jgi:hypothetical protein